MDMKVSAESLNLTDYIDEVTRAEVTTTPPAYNMDGGASNIQDIISYMKPPSNTKPPMVNQPQPKRVTPKWGKMG